MIEMVMTIFAFRVVCAIQNSPHRCPPRCCVKQCGSNVQQNRWKGPNSQIQCFTMGRQELSAENAEKTPKLEKLKHKLLNVLKWYDLYWVAP